MVYLCEHIVGQMLGLLPLLRKLDVCHTNKDNRLLEAALALNFNSNIYKLMV